MHKASNFGRGYKEPRLGSKEDNSINTTQPEPESSAYTKVELTKKNILRI